MMGVRDLRAFCREPMGVPVAFAGASTYTDDGSPVCGLFDRAISDQFGYQGTAGVQSAEPQLRLPLNAFPVMPTSGDVLTVNDGGVVTPYAVSGPTAQSDGAFLVYDLHLAGLPTVDLEASFATGQSIASDVIDAVVTILGGNAANAWRCRFRLFAPTELPADNVLPEQGTPSYEDTSDTERPFRFMVRHLAMATDAADKVADTRYVRAVRLLMADPTLGGLVRYVREVDTKWEYEEQEQQIASLVVTYEAQFSTSRTDPSVPGY